MNVDSGLRLQLGGYVLFGDDAVIGSPMSLLTDDSDKSDSEYLHQETQKMNY